MQDELWMLDEKEKPSALPARSIREGRNGVQLEKYLQSLIEKCPDVIPGKQIDSSLGGPPRFILLGKEMPVGTGSLDLLLVDQKGVLTLVEAKLIENTGARREVIGQILEYAANAAISWGNGQARIKSGGSYEGGGDALDQAVTEFRPDLDVDAFWRKVEQNLADGHIRLVIAADQLHPEVRRIIEFLNEQLKTAEVYGVELATYGKDTGSTVLAPRLIGQTQAIVDKKGTTVPKTLWSVDKLREVLKELDDAGQTVLAQRLGELLEVAESRLRPSKSDRPCFCVRTATGGSCLWVSPDNSSGLFVDLKESNYLGGADQRDRLAAALVEAKILTPERAQGAKGRYLKPAELTPDQFRQLVAAVRDATSDASCANPAEVAGQLGGEDGQTGESGWMDGPGADCDDPD